MQALLHHEAGFDRKSLENNYFFGFNQHVLLNMTVVVIADGLAPANTPGLRWSDLGSEKIFYLHQYLIAQVGYANTLLN